MLPNLKGSGKVHLEHSDYFGRGRQNRFSPLTQLLNHNRCSLSMRGMSDCCKLSITGTWVMPSIFDSFSYVQTLTCTYGRAATPSFRATYLRHSLSFLDSCFVYKEEAGDRFPPRIFQSASRVVLNGVGRQQDFLVLKPQRTSKAWRKCPCAPFLLIEWSARNDCKICMKLCTTGFGYIDGRSFGINYVVQSVSESWWSIHRPRVGCLDKTYSPVKVIKIRS